MIQGHPLLSAAETIRTSWRTQSFLGESPTRRDLEAAFLLGQV
jgi:hypothetical protein